MLHLEKNQVPAFLRGSYSGQMFKAKPCEEMTINPDAGLWSGGSRDIFSAIELSTGRSLPLPNQADAPWSESRTERKITLRPNFAIVRHSVFQGKDLGLTFYVHPDDVARLIPSSAASDLSETEIKVLAILRGVKSSYRPDYYSRAGIKPAQVEGIKARLLSLGLVDKRGAITVAGKTACANVNPY